MANEEQEAESTHAVDVYIANGKLIFNCPECKTYLKLPITTLQRVLTRVHNRNEIVV